MHLPQTLVHWVLAGSATAAIIFFAVGLTTYFEAPRVRPRWVGLIHDSALVLALVHLAAAILIPPRSDAFAIAGIAMYWSAIAVFLSAIEAARRTRLQRSFIDEPLPDRLITDGPFRWVRHPFFAGYILGALAAPVAIESVVLWLLGSLMVGITVSAAIREERVWLASPMGDKYREYRRKTGMFLPFIGRGT
jgi:protein-S-isoprenylcysteine O-methyltransferase Ste14